jgi:hypothetical protein
MQGDMKSTEDLKSRDETVKYVKFYVLVYL